MAPKAALLLAVQLSLLVSFISPTVTVNTARHLIMRHRFVFYNPPPPAAPVKPPVQVHPPVKVPTKPPVQVHPPIKVPTKPPVPVHPPVTKPPGHLPVRKHISIRGVVYCKSCKDKGVNTLEGAKPLFKAVVKLECNNTNQQPLVETTETNKNGVYVFRPKKVSERMEFRNCKVFLVSSIHCRARTNLNSGVSGAFLIHERRSLVVVAPPSTHFNVMPLAFEPSKKC